MSIMDASVKYSRDNLASSELKAQMEFLRREVDCCDQLGTKAAARIERQIQETKERKVSE